MNVRDILEHIMTYETIPANKTIGEIVCDAIELNEADGLYYAEAPCGCSKDEISPGDCMCAECELALSEAEYDPSSPRPIVTYSQMDKEQNHD